MPAAARRTVRPARAGNTDRGAKRGGDRGGGRPPWFAGRPHLSTPAEQHAEWLGLLRPDGPYLTVPVLAETLPHGLDTVPAEVRDRVRQGWTEVCQAPDLLTPAWVELILGELLRYPASVRTDGTVLPAEVVPGGFRPDLVMWGPQPGGGRAARLHVYTLPAGTALTTARGDQPAPVERAAQVCRQTRTPLALLTNGQHWALVHARPGEATGTGVFDADLWLEEPALLRAFATLLAASRVLTPPNNPDGTPTTGLAALFARSAEALTQITTTLGDQVRQAVELFVAELARLDRESGGALLAGVGDREIYRGSLTVLMRLVFLLYAEEQRLLPITDPVYQQAYAASTLYGQLRATRNLYGDEVGDRRTAAWPRLLALFAAVHGGCEHPDLRIPAHGGSLFDPERFGWLADAAVTDRVVHEILDALLVLRHRGKAAEQLSYSSLGVEQIGHVYEGLLDFSCVRVTTPHLGLIGKREPELALAELTAHAETGEEALCDWLVKQCELTPRQLAKARAATPGPHELAALHAACDNDAELAERVRPYWGLLRTDLRGMPTVFPAGSVLFTQAGDRRATGTHYTPRELAEEIVQHTLAPLCFAPGPAEGRTDPGVWRAKTADELLRLKVLDPAMGSGAFLVSACRYLADVLVRAWDRDGLPANLADLAGGNRDDLLLAARRLVAARCLYGVDRDDMAVELAKLSLWLVTLAKGKPFGFLDHALRCGDSLVGITSIDQLTAFHLDPAGGRALHARLYNSVTDRLHELVGKVTALRESIESSVVEDVRQVADKAAKLDEAEWLGRGLRLAADAVVGAALSTAGRSQRRPWEAEDPEDDHEQRYDDRLTSISDDVYAVLRGSSDSAATSNSASSGWASSGSELERRLADTIAEWLRGPRPAPIRPLHWPLEFPEVINRGGFDAVFGNPPFVGGTFISGTSGKDFQVYIQQYVANGRRAKGRADLCSYFLLRGLVIGEGSRIGIIATNSIAQADTREVGLDQAVDRGWQIYRANKTQRWPGSASVEVSLVWVGRTRESEPRFLDGRHVKKITSALLPESRITGEPLQLAANFNKSFKGVEPGSTKFVIEPAEALELLEKYPQNRAVLCPFLNADDLNSTPDTVGRRWIINFHDWDLAKAKQYAEVFQIAEGRVKPDCARKNPASYVGLMEKWWIYWRRRKELLDAISELKKVIAIARHSSTGVPSFVSTSQVLSEALTIFPTDRGEDLATLSSNLHFSWWTTKGESSIRSDPRYTSKSAF